MSRRRNEDLSRQYPVIRIVNNSTSQEKSRGFDINYRMVQDYVERGVIEIEYKASRDMMADALNKPVGKNIYRNFCEFIKLGGATSLEGSEETQDQNGDTSEEM